MSFQQQKITSHTFYLGSPVATPDLNLLSHHQRHFFLQWWELTRRPTIAQRTVQRVRDLGTFNSKWEVSMNSPWGKGTNCWEEDAERLQESWGLDDAKETVLQIQEDKRTDAYMNSQRLWQQAQIQSERGYRHQSSSLTMKLATIDAHSHRVYKRHWRQAPCPVLDGQHKPNSKVFLENFFVSYCLCIFSYLF